MTEKLFNFTLTGTFVVEPGLTPERAFDGRITGFKLPDGRKVALVVGLEIESAEDEDETFEYVTSESDMEPLGLHVTEYVDAHFEESEEE